MHDNISFSLKMHCSDKLDQWVRQHGFSGGTDEMIQEFCTNNYHDLIDSIKIVNGKIPEVMQDLFMEEGIYVLKFYT